MKLFYSPASPFARKCRVIVHELGLKLEEISVNPIGNEELRRVNPLGKVPALVLDDGSALIDSAVICEYLNDLGGGRFFPGTSPWRGGSGRWRALGLQALADGMADAAVALMQQRRLPEERRNDETMARHRAGADPRPRRAGADEIRRSADDRRDRRRLRPGLSRPAPAGPGLARGAARAGRLGTRPSPAIRRCRRRRPPSTASGRISHVAALSRRPYIPALGEESAPGQPNRRGLP